MSELPDRTRSTLIHSALVRFARTADGVAAIEFALLLPIMICIFVCVSELHHGSDNNKKAILLARTVSDLTSLGDSTDPMKAATMDDIIASARLVMRPFDGTSAKIVVSALGVYSVSGTLRPKVCSSYASANATKRATGDPADLTVPGGMIAGARYVLTEVTMGYKPMLGSQIVKYLGSANGQITFSIKQPWPARGGSKHKSGTEVTLPGGDPCP